MSQQTLEKLRACIPVFTLLADENRQQILDLLYESGEMNVSDLTEKIHLSRPAVSHHLRLLLENELVSVNQIGKERYYSVSFEPTIALLGDLLKSLKQDYRQK